MKKLLLILTIFCSTFLIAQDNVVLSEDSANEKGISPIWPKCDDSRLSLEKCFGKNLRRHVLEKFRYPEVARKDGLEGTVSVEFIINTKGKVEVIEVTGGHRYLQREAIRIVREIPKMKPAKWGKKPIAIAYELPITFIKPTTN